MKVDFYKLRGEQGRFEPDLEHELPRVEAVARAKCGETVLLKIWLRTDGVARLDEIEAAIAGAVQPLGIK
jgi:hypothetical protein